MVNASATLNSALPHPSGRLGLRLLLAAAMALSCGGRLTAEQPLLLPIGPPEVHQRTGLALDCWAAWVEASASLDESQLASLKQLGADRAVRLGEEHWQQLQASQSGQLAPGFPVRFQFAPSPLSQFCSPETALPLVAEGQYQRLLNADNVRSREHHAATRDYGLAILDSHLFLSDTQWAALQQTRPRVDLPFFFTQLKSSYLPNSPIRSIVTETDREQLTPRQLQRLELMASANDGPGSSVLFRSNETREIWDQRLQDLVRLKRDKIVLRLGLRVDDLERNGAVSGDQANQLRTVAKRMGVALCDEWRVLVRPRLDRFAERVQARERAGLAGVSTYSMSILDPGLETPEKQPLWKSAIAADDPSQARIQTVEASHRTRLQDARDRAVLVMLDRELWLTSEQRQAMLPLLREALPPAGIVPETSESWREFTWLAHAFCIVDFDRLSQVLNPAQLAAWRRMQSHFPICANISPHAAALSIEGNSRTQIPLIKPSGEEWLETPGKSLPGQPPVAPPEVLPREGGF